MSLSLILQAWLQVVSILYASCWRRSELQLKTVSAPIKTLVCLIILGLGVVLWGKRMVIVAASYGWFRWIDDVVDRDSILTGQSIEDFLIERKGALDRYKDGQRAPRDYDAMLWYFMATAQELRIELRPRVEQLLCLIESDFIRQSGSIVLERNELDALAMGYDSCILGAIVFLLGGDADQMEQNLLERKLLGIFNRTDWLHDLPNDLSRGIINIPREAIGQFDIKLEALARCNSLDQLLQDVSFARWFSEEQRYLQECWARLTKLLDQGFAGAFRTHSQSQIAKFVFLHWFNRSALLRNPVDP